MGCHQSVTIGPFLQYAAPVPDVDGYDLLPEQRLYKTFPMSRNKAGDVYVPNIHLPGCVRIDNDDGDMALDITASRAEQISAFLATFAREIEVLDAAYGKEGVVCFGVVVSWG